MQTLADIKEILTQFGLAPRKSLGQNFLIDHNLIRKLIDAAGVKAGDCVLEIGPGTGTMTEELLERGCRVVAAELDAGLCRALRAKFAERGGGGDGFTLVEGDCLDTKHKLSEGVIAALGGEPFVVVSNLPYGAATPVMSILLADYAGQCRGLFVTIQLEVAQRLSAKAGTKQYGTLSVLAECVAEVEVVGKLRPECFWPRPEVVSAMVALRRKASPECEDPRGLCALCQRMFEKRRKQIGAVLGRDVAWPAGVKAESRVEDLALPELIALWREMGAPSAES